MFQTFDKSSPHARQSWMALLARAPQHFLEQALATHSSSQPEWLRRPETGLMMVQARVGGTGERFNLGEVTVTRCALRLTSAASNAPVGVSYVLGRNHRQAQLAAVADALLQDPEQHAALAVSLLTPFHQYLQTHLAARHARAQTTKVDFMTVAREAGGDDEGKEA
jgi:alpha-D-ribose 1-methylphosphonate 5-triphosphate synthase subunit PhnG